MRSAPDKARAELLQKAANQRKAAKALTAAQEQEVEDRVMKAELARTANALDERGERLQQLDTKMANMNANAGNFLETIKQMNRKEEKKSFWQI